MAYVSEVDFLVRKTIRYDEFGSDQVLLERDQVFNAFSDKKRIRVSKVRDREMTYNVRRESSLASNMMSNDTS